MREARRGRILREQRLDKAVQSLFPELGLRGCRRLWAYARVLVNGRARSRGFAVRPGDWVEVLPRPEERAGGEPAVLDERDGLFFLFKPAGLHTAALAGAATPSLERCLPALLPGEARLRLLTRLDMWTSGIVLAAASPELAARFRAEEAAGCWEKRYVAVLAGELRTSVLARQALDTARCATTKVLSAEAPPLRRTLIVPLGSVAGRAVPLTLAGCSIHKGARHQIRAHAAAAGYPLWGDGRYGKAVSGTGKAGQGSGAGVAAESCAGRADGAPDGLEERFFLHCGAVFRAKEREALVPPPAKWGLETEELRAALRWLGNAR